MDTNQNLKESTSEALTDFQFSDLFEIEKIQQLQDLFAETHGVASVITHPDGVPITSPSNFTRLCNDIIRKTKKGCTNCFKSDTALGRHNPSGPIVQPCLSGGLWDAGASITVGGRHIASWLIGQVRNEETNEQQMMLYADEIGANQEEFKKALSEVPVMSVKQFNNVAKMLFAFANELSEKAYTNLQLKIQIKEREKATELLQDSEERFQMLFNKAPLGYQSLDSNGFFIEVNQQWLNLLGYTRQEVIGKWFGDFLSPEYQKGFRKRFPIFKAQGHIHSEFEMVHKNGSKLFIAFEGKIGYSLDGEFKQTHCILQDITQRKQAEEEMRKNEQMLQTVLDHFPGVVFWKDKQSNFLGCNQEFAIRAGLNNPTEIIGKTDFDLPWAETDAENYRSDDFQVMESGKAKLHIVEMQHPAEDLVLWLNTSKIPLLDSNGQVIGLIGVSNDITELKRSEDALRKSEATQRKLVANIGDVIVIIDKEGINRYKSPNIEKWFGWQPEELIGASTWDNVHPEDLEAAQIFFGSLALKENNTGKTELRYRCKDGNYKWIEFTGVNLLHDKDIYGILGNYHDITERKLAEQKITMLAHAVHSISECISITDMADKILYVNNAFLKTFQYKESELIGKSISIVQSPNNSQNILQEILPSTLQGQWKGELLNLRKDGSEFPVFISTSVIKNENGEPIALIGVSNDITERKQAENELILSKEKAEESELKLKNKNEELVEKNTFIQTILDNLPIGLALNNINEGDATYMNKKFEEIYGWTSNEMTSIATFFEKVYPDEEYRNQLIGRIMVDINSGDPEKMHWENIFVTRKDGSKRVVNAVNIPLIEQNTMVSTVLDITALHEIQNDLIKSKEKAEESDRLKSAFLNNISHEIRTPFNAILGFLAIMQDDDITTSERNEYFGIINKSSDRLINTINDIVEISKIQTGQVKMTLSETNIKKLTSEIFNQYRNDILNQGLTFTINNKLPDTIDCFSTDTAKLKTILSNLVGNALKFTKEGTIELGIRLIDEAVSDKEYSRDKACLVSTIEFSVKDTGVGIPKNKQGLIFDRFIQADVSNTRQFEGLGLGLSITKAYVELLGGKIGVESQVGKGSNFYFTLPYTSAPEVKDIVHKINNAEDQENTAIKLKILIVEDDEGSLKFLQLAVKMIGKEIISVKNGVDAVKACRENPDIDLILMDIQMPEMNGYEATRQIREFNQEVIIIAQTAFALSGDKEKSIEAGCNDYISKPIKKDRILEMVQKHFKLNGTYT